MALSKPHSEKDASPKPSTGAPKDKVLQDFADRMTQSMVANLNHHSRTQQQPAKQPSKK